MLPFSALIAPVRLRGTDHSLEGGREGGRAVVFGTYLLSTSFYPQSARETAPEDLPPCLPTDD